MGASTGTGIVESLTSSFSTVASDAMSAIGAILPIALPILGAIVAIGIGIKVFKKTSGQN